MSYGCTVGVQKKHGAEHSDVMLLDVDAQSVKDRWEWILTYDHGQYRVIQHRQSLGGSRLLGGCRSLNARCHDHLV
jgi:hypothetical protein